MRGSEEGINVVFLIKMGIIPSYTIAMENLDWTLSCQLMSYFSRI